MPQKKFGYGGSANVSGLPKGVRAVNPMFTPDQFRRFAAAVNKTLADLTALDGPDANKERITLSIKGTGIAVMLVNAYLKKSEGRDG